MPYFLLGYNTLHSGLEDGVEGQLLDAPGIVQLSFLIGMGEEHLYQVNARKLC